MADIEIVARVERRRKWSAEEKAALVAEIAAEGGKVSLVARRHRIAESLLYNWRAAWKAAASAAGSTEFVPLGVVRHADETGAAMLRSPEPAGSRPSHNASTVSPSKQCEADAMNSGSGGPAHSCASAPSPMTGSAEMRSRAAPMGMSVTVSTGSADFTGLG